jgi:hypothetical protein
MDYFNFDLEIHIEAFSLENGESRKVLLTVGELGAVLSSVEDAANDAVADGVPYDMQKDRATPDIFINRVGNGSIILDTVLEFHKVVNEWASRNPFDANLATSYFTAFTVYLGAALTKALKHTNKQSEEREIKVKVNSLKLGANATVKGRKNPNRSRRR